MSKTTNLRRLRRAQNKPPQVVGSTQIVTRALSDLVPYADNARTHSSEQIAQLAASILEFGFTVPCLIDKNDVLIAGHGRVLAAQELKMEMIPCIVADYLSERQVRAYRLADNQLALNASWDLPTLGLELDVLNDEAFDIDLIGFDENELANIWKDGSGLGEGGDASQETLKNSWAVIVECKTEADQVELLERLQTEGYNVRGSIG